eukprot:TRINITY_DN659761_c0_g1_i3.p1 TRINITY_DN659761_c0_g1~~TRINITY_DN659761_c0_g1_i3.p1  ORF type:complete len:165 (-),score=60.69 TRINITY_DN659761_c0_g1_i3:217-711(-)
MTTKASKVCGNCEKFQLQQFQAQNRAGGQVKRRVIAIDDDPSSSDEEVVHKMPDVAEVHKEKIRTLVQQLIKDELDAVKKSFASDIFGLKNEIKRLNGEAEKEEKETEELKEMLARKDVIDKEERHVFPLSKKRTAPEIVDEPVAKFPFVEAQDDKVEISEFGF